MKLRFIAATICTLVATLGLALAQQGQPPPSGPKPTKADVQKVVQIISGDKAKTQAYCELNNVYDQMQAADEKKDTKTVQALGKQANALEAKLGPEYSKLVERLEEVDPDSSEGKEFASILSDMDKLCTR